MTAHTATGAVDCRVLRTRGRLQRAHAALILEKGYEATTVKDICDAAKIGRSTFYSHFASKADLRRSCFAGLRRHLAEHQRNARSRERGKTLAFGLPLFEHARDHAYMYRALVGGRGGAIALDEIRKIVAELVGAELRGGTRGGEGAVDPHLRGAATAYLVGAFMAVLRWWLDAGAKLPPEHVDALFRRFAGQGVVP